MVKKGKPKVSIVMTVHNAEAFLEECVNSVLGQSYREIELLCIDGGSTDRSSDILKSFDDHRLMIINDKNTSYGHKVNRGISEANGEYIAIIESDDYYHKDMIRNLIVKAEEFHPDVIDGDIYAFFDYKGMRTGFVRIKGYSGKTSGWIKESKEQYAFAHGAICTALYRREFILNNSIKCNESPGASYQDQGFSFLVDLCAEKIYHVNVPVYCYRLDNDNSSMVDDRKIFEIVYEMRFIEDELRKRKVLDDVVWREYYRLKYDSIWWKMDQLSPSSRELLKPVFINEIVKDNNSGVFSKGMLPQQDIDKLWKYVEKPEAYNEKQRGIQDAERYTAILDKIYDDIRRKPNVILGVCRTGRELCGILQDLKIDVVGIGDIGEINEKETVSGVCVHPISFYTNKTGAYNYIVASKKRRTAILAELKALNVFEETIIDVYN